MRRLRAGLVTLLPGGPGQPSARIMTGCLQWLDARDTKGGGSRPDGEARAASPVRPRGSTAYGDTKRRQWSAGRRLSASQAERARLAACRAAAPAAQEASQASAFPGAPLPFFAGAWACRAEARKGEGGEYRRPRAVDNRGDESRLLFFLPWRALN